jgi:rod shape-determining protein MreD
VRPAAFVLAGLFVAAVQAVLLRWVGGGAVSLQLLVPCIVWLALEAENVEGVVSAAAIGCVIDAFAGGPSGLFTFLGVVLFLGSRAAGMAVDLRGKAGFAVLSGAGCLLLSVAAVLLQRWAGDPEAAPGALLVPRMILEALLTAAASPLVLVGMNRLGVLLGREEPELMP